MKWSEKRKSKHLHKRIISVHRSLPSGGLGAELFASVSMRGM
ncbi:hypothetical protein GCWU000341_00674 [Oribacterium sp. oral taxon 078 str. F0262]|nr:hypothetical protein GCWU000341_00674 [Oribacterium sp. oral taxon 078 str. F0262]